MQAVRRVDVKQEPYQSLRERYLVQVARGGKPLLGVRSDRISTIEEEVMEWQDAYHIDQWFKDNVQGDSSCGDPCLIEWYSLDRLLSACNRILSASELVHGATPNNDGNDEDDDEDEQRDSRLVIADPSSAKGWLHVPQEHCKDTEALTYDEAYLKHVADTRDWLVRMLAEHNDGVPGDIYYSSAC